MCSMYFVFMGLVIMEFGISVVCEMTGHKQL
jgi:hypothetical protein